MLHREDRRAGAKKIENGLERGGGRGGARRQHGCHHQPASVGAGLGDRCRFDVSLLMDGGHQDTARATVPVIVAEVSSLTGGTATRALRVIGGNTQTVAKTNAAGFWKQVAHARRWLDGRVNASLDPSTSTVDRATGARCSATRPPARSRWAGR